MRIFDGDFKSMIYSLQFEVPDYNRWLLHDADMATTYRWHRRFLEHLQSEHSAQRWVLKSPVHMWNLPTLMAEYPDAIVVQTHRDPLKVIASISVLGASLREMTSDHVDLTVMSQQYAADIADAWTVRSTPDAPGWFPGTRSSTCTSASSARTRSPRSRAVYDALGIELSAEAESAHARLPRRAPGRSRQRARSATRSRRRGLDEAPLREPVREYQEYFGVPSETLS